MIKPTLILLAWFFALNLTAQEVVVEYPYNPDFENDGNVGVEDLLQLLSSFGMAFEVGELTIDEVVLSEWLQTISQTLIAQQSMIDSLMSDEANSEVSQLDSALIADMINEAVSATASFGERVHLGEPEDWGPLPWDDYVNYGTYDFDDAGIFMGRFQYPFNDIYVLHDSLDVQELSSSELQNHSVAGESNGSESFSVAVGIDERIIVKGLPGSFGDSYHYNFSWVPLSTSSLDAASEGESLGLAFGEKEFWDLDGFEWLPIDFPQMDVTFIEAQTDGILHVDGTTVAYPPYGLAVVPSDLLPCDDFGDCDGMTIALIFMGDDFENYQYNSFSYADAAPVTIAVKEGEVICLRKNSNTASWQRFIWVPIVSDSSAYNEPVNQGPYSAISDTLIIDVGDQYSDWYGSPVPFAAEKPFVKFVGQAPVNSCYFELANPNDSVPDVVIFNASENIVRGNTFTGGNYLMNNEWIHLRAVGDQWFKPWYDH